MRARPASWLIIIALVLWASPRAMAAGDETAPPIEPVETTVAQAPPPVAAAAPEPEAQLTERTAYMVGRHKFKLGILAFEYGILQQLSVGTDPPAWAVGAYLSIVVPNLHLKYQILDRDPVAVAVQAAGYYGSLNQADIDGNLLDLPLTAFVSVRVHPRITLHAEGAYVYSQVFGTGNVTRASVNGSVAVRSGQLGLVAQYQVTRVISLLAIGRYQFYTADLPLRGGNMSDPYTTTTLSGQYVPAVRHPWEALAGAAFLWRHFQLTVAAGYGYYFVPGMDIANPKRTFVPDGSIAVVL